MGGATGSIATLSMEYAERLYSVGKKFINKSAVTSPTASAEPSSKYAHVLLLDSFPC